MSVYRDRLKSDKPGKLQIVDPIRNPYTPNAGAQPPAVIGRDDQIASFDVLLERMAGGAPSSR